MRAASFFLLDRRRFTNKIGAIAELVTSCGVRNVRTGCFQYREDCAVFEHMYRYRNHDARRKTISQEVRTIWNRRIPDVSHHTR